jgi:hypothetical protein
MEQVYDPSDKIFVPPQALYLDQFDSILLNYKAVPYDFVPDNTGAGQQLFGIYGKNAPDLSGNITRTWTFNLSRLVQNIVNKKEPYNDFRVLTHRAIPNQIRANNQNNTGAYSLIFVPINSLYGVGRVRLGGGNHPTHKMRMRIIYTKI